MANAIERRARLQYRYAAQMRISGSDQPDPTNLIRSRADRVLRRLRRQLAQTSRITSVPRLPGATAWATPAGTT